MEPRYKKTWILVAFGDSAVNSTRVPAGAETGSGRLPEKFGFNRNMAVERCTQPSASCRDWREFRNASIREIPRTLLRKTATDASEMTAMAKVHSNSADPRRFRFFVLDRRTNMRLLLTKTVLECQPFH